MQQSTPQIVIDPLLDLVHEAFAETTPSGTLLRFNRRLLDIFPQFQEAKHPRSEVNLFDALQDEHSALEKLRAGLKYPLVVKTSSLSCGKELEISISRLGTSEAPTLGWIIRDITLAQRQEEKLQLQIEKLRFVLEGAGLGSWDWNLETHAVSFDERWCKMIGLDPRTTPMHLETWSSRVHPDDLDGAYQDIRAHIDGKTPQYENIHRLRHSDGRWIWILDKGKITERDSSGKPTRFSGIHLDITLQKMAEEELKASRELLDLTTSTYEVGIWEYLIETRGLRWHRSMHTIFGVPENSSESLETIFRNAVSASHQEIISRKFYEAIANETDFDIEYPIHRPDGTERLIRSKGVLHRNSTERAVRMIGLNWDVTEERKREQALEQERMMNLHAARMASLGEMAGGIAHEINSPLAVITMRASQLREYLSRENPDPAMVGILTETLETTALRIAKIVQVMKNLSRESSRDSMTLTPVAGIISDALLIIQERFRLLSIDLQVRITPENLSLVCHSTELSQVILNLLTNARDAVESRSQRWVHVDVQEVEGRIQFEISDSGAGLTQEQRTQLFRPFFTTKPVGRGTGLGLGICRQIVQRHGGSISYLENTAHTTFRVVLPKNPG